MNTKMYQIRTAAFVRIMFMVGGAAIAITGSQFFVRRDDGTFGVEANEVNETPTTVVS